MPEIGSITIFKDRRHIWVACPICGHERWVRSTHPELYSLHCGKCKAWKGGKHTNKQGYVLIKLFQIDFYFPMANSHGYVLEHRLVMAQHLGRCLQPFESVHHRNGVRDDNRIANLELGTRNSHIRDHNKGYRDGYQKGLMDGRNKQVQELKDLMEEQTKQIKLFQWQIKELLAEKRAVR
jgi:hypothetical protein